jgi:hypothetical protein
VECHLKLWQIWLIPLKVHTTILWLKTLVQAQQKLLTL